MKTFKSYTIYTIASHQI